MVDSLRDQLLKSGIVKQVRKDKPPRGRGGKGGKGGGKPPAAKSGGGGKRTDGDIDLARAYAMRARTEARERKQAKAEAEAEARARRERKQRLQAVLKGKALNKADAEHARHFEYGGKIRRVYVDAGQLQRINAGELGVVQHGGRYLVVTADVLEAVRAAAPEHVALAVDPGAETPDDGVPDDLVW